MGFKSLPLRQIFLIYNDNGNMVSHRLPFAVVLLQKGVPLGEVSKLLGHTSIKTTEYAKRIKGRQVVVDTFV